jgi:uncharacterized protein DUF4214
LLGSDGTMAGNIAYVNALYNQVLGRVADVDGVNYWVYQLDLGTSRQQVADAIWESAEHRSLQVEQFYENFLHRAADQAGLNYWGSLFKNGASEADVAAGFLSSGEYQADHPGDAAFVTGLYQDTLGRSPDTTGLTYWESVLRSGASRPDVARAFLTSAEASQNVLDRFYAQFLGHGVDPQGLQAWIPALQAGGQTTVADLILSSDEFLQRSTQAFA